MSASKNERNERYTWGDGDSAGEVVEEGTGEVVNLTEHLAKLQEQEKNPSVLQRLKNKLS